MEKFITWWLLLLFRGVGIAYADNLNRSSLVVDLGYEVFIILPVKCFMNRKCEFVVLKFVTARSIKATIMPLRTWTSLKGMFESHMKTHFLRLASQYSTNSQYDFAFISLRYAAPPTGPLRWQKPEPPVINRGSVLNATVYPSRCPQSPDSPLWVPRPGFSCVHIPGPMIHVNIALSRATNFDFDKSGLGDEDCLFTTVFAPTRWDLSHVEVLFRYPVDAAGTSHILLACCRSCTLCG